MPSRSCSVDNDRLSFLRPCMADDACLAAAAPYVPFDPFADPNGFPLCCISKRTVVFSCGAIAHQGDILPHNHPPGELALCQRLANRAAKLMEGVEVGMGSEGTPINGTDFFLPFFVTANEGVKIPKTLTEKQVRAAFGGVIYPKCSVRVEALRERGKWWESVLHWYAGSDEEYQAEMFQRWRKMMEWFTTQSVFQSTAFVMIGDGPGDGGATFPRLALGVTPAGSLVGIAGNVVHT